MIGKKKSRTLKARAVGDFWKGKVVPEILIRGRWVQAAGIPLDALVEVTNPKPGMLVIQVEKCEHGFAAACPEGCN